MVEVHEHWWPQQSHYGGSRGLLKLKVKRLSVSVSNKFSDNCSLKWQPITASASHRTTPSTATCPFITHQEVRYVWKFHLQGQFHGLLLKACNLFCQLFINMFFTITVSDHCIVERDRVTQNPIYDEWQSIFLLISCFQHHIPIFGSFGTIFIVVWQFETLFRKLLSTNNCQ